MLLAMMLWACEGKNDTSEVDGSAIFSRACARCHGPRGVPTQAMVARLGVRSLTSARVATQLTDAEVRSQILNGSANQLMPAFVGALDDAEIAAVVAHVRTLSGHRVKAPSTRKAN